MCYQDKQQMQMIKKLWMPKYVNKLSQITAYCMEWEGWIGWLEKAMAAERAKGFQKKFINLNI